MFCIIFRNGIVKNQVQNEIIIPDDAYKIRETSETMMPFCLVCRPRLTIWGPLSIPFHQSRKMRSESLRKSRLSFANQSAECCSTACASEKTYCRTILIYIYIYRRMNRFYCDNCNFMPPIKMINVLVQSSDLSK